MTNPHDAGIPVLTEIIPLSQPDATAGVPAAAEIVPPTTAPARPIQQWKQEYERPVPPAAPVARLDDGQWLQMERDIRQRVLQQVMERIDSALEQRVRDSLADVLQLAVDNLATEIRQGLHRSLRDAVAQAVAREIQELKNAEK